LFRGGKNLQKVRSLLAESIQEKLRIEENLSNLSSDIVAQQQIVAASQRLHNTKLIEICLSQRATESRTPSPAGEGGGGVSRGGRGGGDAASPSCHGFAQR
jgi:hypothetical protein